MYGSRKRSVYLFAMRSNDDNDEGCDRAYLCGDRTDSGDMHHGWRSGIYLF